MFQWRSSVNWHNWNTLEDYWKATGRPLEAHWLPTFQCALGSKFQAHWITTGRPLAQGKGYDSVRPPSGLCARANIGVKWDHESMTMSAKHTKIYFVSSISRNLHMISKAKPKWSFCWQISEFGCSHHPSPSMATRDTRQVAIAARGYGYITSGQLIDSNQQE